MQRLSRKEMVFVAITLLLILEIVTLDNVMREGVALMPYVIDTVWAWVYLVIFLFITNVALSAFCWCGKIIFKRLIALATR